MFKKLLLLMIVLSFLLTGCYDRKEIDDYAYVIAIGVEKGEGDMYKFTASVANPNVIGEAKEKAEGALSNISCVATDFFSATEIMNYNLSKKINLSHTKLIIFSSQLARDGLKKFTDSFVRELKIRPATLVAISEKPSEYLDNLKPLLEVNPEKYFQEIFDKDNANFSESATLSEVFYATNSKDRNIILPIMGVMENDDEKKPETDEDAYNKNDVSITKVMLKSDNKAMITGIAFFADDKLIMEGTTYEDIFHSFISKKTGKISYTVNVSEGEKDNLAVSLTEFKKPEIDIDCNGNPKINIKIFADCEVLYLPKSIAHSKNSKEISDIVANDLKQNITEYLTKTRDVLKTDTENLSRYAKRRFLTYNAWNEYNWKEKYKNAYFNVDAEINVVQFGVLKEGE